MLFVYLFILLPSLTYNTWSELEKFITKKIKNNLLNRILKLSDFSQDRSILRRANTTFSLR